MGQGLSQAAPEPPGKCRYSGTGPSLFPSLLSPTTVAVSSPSPKESSVPGFVFRPGLVRHSQTPSPRSFRRSTSTAPPVGTRCPNNRAGRTRESFNTRQSPAAAWWEVQKNGGVPTPPFCGPSPAAGIGRAAPEASVRSALLVSRNKITCFQTHLLLSNGDTCIVKCQNFVICISLCSHGIGAILAHANIVSVARADKQPGVAGVVLHRCTGDAA